MRPAFRATSSFPRTEHFLHRTAYVVRARDRCLLQIGIIRCRHIGGAQPLHRRFELEERGFAQARRYFGADTGEAAVLFHHDRAMRAPYRLAQQRQIERPQAAQVDDLGFDAIPGKLRGGLDGNVRPDARRSASRRARVDAWPPRASGVARPRHRTLPW